MHEMESVKTQNHPNMAFRRTRIVSAVPEPDLQAVCFLKTPTAHRANLDELEGYRFKGKYIMRDLVLSGYGRSQVFQVKCLSCGKIQFSDDLCPLCDSCNISVTRQRLDNILNRDTWRLTDMPVIGNIVGWIQKTEIIGKGNKVRYNFLKVYKRDKYICQYCGYNPREHDEFIPLHIDHIHPRSAGGSYRLENLVVACSICNGIASDKVFNRFCDKWLYIRKVRKDRGLILYDEPEKREWED